MHNVNVFSNIFIYSKYILCYITYMCCMNYLLEKIWNIWKLWQYFLNNILAAFYILLA